MKPIFIILFIIILFYLSNLYFKSTNIKVENFDNRIERLLERNCGTLCTNVNDCGAFAYDASNNVCWISKDKIFKKPISSLYTQDYNKKFMRCNKLAKIDDPVIAKSSDYVNNAIYQCKPTEESKSDTYTLYTENTSKSGELTDLKSTDMNKYKISELDWPTLFNPLDFSDVKLIIYPDKKKLYIMREKDTEYLGEPLYEHECVANIEKKDCITSCLDDIECQGTEYNTSFIQNKNGKSIRYRNVCCPRKAISKIIPRRDDFMNGKFYFKNSIVMSDVMAEKDVVLL